MSNMVTTQTKSLTHVEDQSEDEFVPTLHKGTRDELENKLGLLSKVFHNEPMIQLTLDGRKAVIKQSRKSITVRCHYWKRKASNIELNIKDEGGKAGGVKDPDYPVEFEANEQNLF
jgi:hypothetical protein